MNPILLLLPLLWSTAAAAQETVAVYQLTGAIRCIEGTGVSPEEAADLLRGQGVKVLSAQRRKLPQDVTDTCGAPAGEANVMEIAAADWTAFLADNPDAGGYGLWVFDQDRVQVYQYDGTMQCGMGHEIPLPEMAKELQAAGIEVLSSRKGSDGLLHISVCGASTGIINVYLIDRGSLPAARRLGYRPLVTRQMTERIKPSVARVREASIAARSPSSPRKQIPNPDPDPVPLLW